MTMPWLQPFQQSTNLQWNTWLENFFAPIHIIFVLEQFIFKPENFEKESKVSRAANRELGEPSRVSDVSSAYYEILCSLWLIKMPFIFLFCFTRIASISAQRRNRYGAMGSPCLQPLFMWNCSDKWPHCKTEALNLLFKICIQSIKFFTKSKKV